jgi:hypothetical protein
MRGVFSASLYFLKFGPFFVSFRQACNFSQERVGLGRTRGEGWRDDWLPREVQQVEAAGTAAVSGDAVASVSR